MSGKKVVRVGGTTPPVSPTLETYGWQVQGACRGEDSELFFLDDNLRGSDKQKKILAAKQVCFRCPVRQECLEYSIKARVPYGVWGGLDQDQRAEILKKMKEVS